jgi:hypothetical protein
MNERDEARKNRLAAALRENLKRRKQQARGRAGGTPPAGTDERDEHPQDDRAGPTKDAGKRPT